MFCLYNTVLSLQYHFPSRTVTQFTASKLCNRIKKYFLFFLPHINKNVNIKRCRIALGGNLVCQREGRTSVRVGEILGVSEGGENCGEFGGDIGCVRGRGEQW